MTVTESGDDRSCGRVLDLVEVGHGSGRSCRWLIHGLSSSAAGDPVPFPRCGVPAANHFPRRGRRHRYPEKFQIWALGRSGSLPWRSVPQVSLFCRLCPISRQTAAGDANRPRRSQRDPAGPAAYTCEWCSQDAQLVRGIRVRTSNSSFSSSPATFGARPQPGACAFAFTFASSGVAGLFTIVLLSSIVDLI